MKIPNLEKIVGVDTFFVWFPGLKFFFIDQSFVVFVLVKFLWKIADIIKKCQCFRLLISKIVSTYSRKSKDRIQLALK